MGPSGNLADKNDNQITKVRKLCSYATCKCCALLCELLIKMHVTYFLFLKVCFHCREPGHGVADCPAVLESQDMGTGICYRCGSTEHDIGKCKAKIDPAVGTIQKFAFCGVLWSEFSSY